MMQTLVAVGGVTVLLASCTTVPTGSDPQVIHSVAVGAHGGQANISPEPGADARSIVAGFLDANAADDPNHNAARAFLTREERNKWSDSTVTIIDRPEIGNLDKGTVPVRGHKIGSIDVNGVYTPVLLGDGTGSGESQMSASFGMQRVKGEWRIDTLGQQGLLISAAQFQRYQQRSLYFFDSSQEHLVPVPRYTQLTEPADLASWLISGLAQGAREGSQSGLTAQTDAKRVVAELAPGGSRIRIEVPGATQLNTRNRDRLGAQVARTLAQVPQVKDIQITDGGRPIRIPAVAGTTFSTADLSDQFVVRPPDTRLYYLRDGALYTAGRRVDGKVGAGVYGLNSVALSPRVGSGELQIAAVRGTGTKASLDLGTLDQLDETRLHGELSRPAWAPDVDEVWIGDGPDLYRVSPSGQLRAVEVEAAVGKVNGTVIAVRLSPEGSRVALVLKSPDGTSQIYVGSVSRIRSDVQITDLTPISPQGVSVRDVAWNDGLKLFAIGTDRSSTNWGLYEVQCDGSLWTLRSSSGLPQAPDSLTVATGSVAVVSTGGTVWRQQAGSWESLVAGETRGTNPVYVE